MLTVSTAVRTIILTAEYNSEYKLVLANILRSRYVTRMPPLEARSPGRRSNIENVPVDGQSPASSARRVADPAERSHCRHIAGWTQACN